MDGGKQGYVTNTLNQNVMKQEQSAENRLDGSVMQQVSEHQNNMGMGMMENMGLGIPMMISSANQQQITSVPMDTSGNSVQTVQAVPGPSSQTTHNQISQSQTSSTQQEEEEESSEDEENSDEECDGDEGLPVKEESEEDPNSRTIEPTTFVNVSLACDEAGPSGLQQQKISDIPEMPMQQPADGDPKSGREPVAAQQKPPIDNASFRLVVVGTWKQRDARPLITRIKQIPQTIIEDLDPLEEFVTFIHSTGNPQENVPETAKDLPGSSTSRNDETEVDHVLEKIRNTCPFCDKRFDSVKKVETHVACVHRRPYQCDKCKKSWRTAEALEEHKVIHRPDYFFECEVCHVKYKSECSLKRHKLRMHSGQESKYVCEHCGRCYKLKMDLSEHVKKIHMTEPQICRFCGKAVKDVKAHEWKHQNHKRYREAKYNLSCHLCQKKFCHRSRLDCHLRRHEEGFRCEMCDKDFLSTKELVRHKQYKHGQTKIYTCIVCKKPFVCSSNFYQHVLTHAGIRPYKCDVCEEDFTQRSSLLRHRRQHPGPLSPLPSTNPRITELAKSYLQKLQNDQIDKSCVLNAKF